MIWIYIELKCRTAELGLCMRLCACGPQVVDISAEQHIRTMDLQEEQAASALPTYAIELTHPDLAFILSGLALEEDRWKHAAWLAPEDGYLQSRRCYDLRMRLRQHGARGKRAKAVGAQFVRYGAGRGATRDAARNGMEQK